MVRANGRRLGQDHEHDRAGRGGSELNPAKVNNVYRVSPGEDLQTVINELESDHGHGAVELTGDYTVSSPVTVPVGITLRSANPSEVSGSRAQIAPSGDNPLLEIETGVDDRGSGVIKYLDLDASGVNGYSSTAVRIIPNSKNPPRAPVIEGCAFHNQTTGTALQVDADPNDAGMGYLKLRDNEYIGWDTIYHLKATTANSYVNGFQARAEYLRGGSSQMILEEGSVGNPYYDLEVQVGGSTGKLIDAATPGSYDVHIYDANNSSEIPGGTFWDFSTTAVQDGDPIRVQTHRGDGGRGGLVTNNPLGTEWWPAKTLNFNITSRGGLPEWLEEGGTGTLSFPDGFSRMTVETGATSGDTKYVRSGTVPNKTGDITVGWYNRVPDTTQTIATAGLVDPGGNFEARFYADPTDSLATGVTSNYVWRVVDTDGTELTATDTGVGFSGRRKLGLGFLAGDTVYGALPSVEQTTALTTLSAVPNDVELRYQVETTEAATKRLLVDFQAKMQWGE